MVNYYRIRSFSNNYIVNFSVTSNYNINSSLKNIALTSGTDLAEAINLNPNKRFSVYSCADCSDRKDKLLFCHSVTYDRDKMVDGGAVVSTAQMPRKLFLAQRKLLTDVNRCNTDQLT